MQYQYISAKTGESYTIKISRGGHYTALQIYNFGEGQAPVYENRYLPVLPTQIAAEDNAARVAAAVIEGIGEGYRV